MNHEKAVLAVFILCLLAAPCVLAEGASATEGKSALVIGIVLIAAAILSYWKTGEGVFFAVFASQGLVHVISYLI